ncbi:endonuclease/exonuclease/phosphatase family protein [Gayadomonas joobiniege]|uniref:endonuclease/exonuclease/phosphatase family protein n=1 Tax=Gayadomonas joobiniege TaxID=1234606 RepID=UPI00037ABFFB|nr:endonuclease/exonuclease/phosphatase family protein [Gayadomonas joobiniege]
MDIFLSCFSTFIVLITLLPFSRHSHWLVRGWDFPRAQISVLASLLLVLQLYFYSFTKITDWIAFLSVLVALGWQISWILPYTPLWKTQVKSALPDNKGTSIKILTSNVLKPNSNTHLLEAHIEAEDPDIIVTLESDDIWQKSLEKFANKYPYAVKCPLDNLYGMHVYSKLEFSEEQLCYLVEDGVPSVHAMVKLGSGDLIRAYFIHPAPPSPSENTYSKERDAELIIVAKDIAKKYQPTIVAGDLNDVSWSPTTRLFRKISGLADPRIGRGMFNTFHAKYWFLRWPLDHLFHSKEFKLKQMRRLASIGSDHFPVLTELVYLPDGKNKQKDLTPDENDKKFAKDIGRSEDVSDKDVPDFEIKTK